MSLTNNDTLLQVNNLKKYFPTPHGLLYAVDNVSFNINKGDTLGVVGESGCGKSTLGVPYLDYMSQRQVKSFSKARIFFHLIMRK